MNTTTLERPGTAGQASVNRAKSTQAQRPLSGPRSAWPLKALLVFFPLWWAIGLGAFAFPLFAIPMAAQLWRHRSRLRFPPGFGFWLAFLALNVVSLAMFRQNVPGTTNGSSGGRVVAIAVNLVEYLSATVTLLYAGNLDRRVLSQQRLIRWLGILGLVTIAGGLLGVLAPNFGYTSPVEMILPASVRTNLYVRALVHPSTAQIQQVLGYEAPRPAAPFGYANYWGNNLSILLVWLVLWQWRRRSRSRQFFVVAALAVAAVPLTLSLNRGVWMGIGFSVVYVAVQLARRGRSGALVGLVAAIVLAALAFLVTPLHTTVSERVAHPGSNELRGFLSTAAIQGAERSPVIGWGGSRKSIGSAQSVAVGASTDCPQCGERNIGSNGQLWYILFAQGFLGAVLYVAFFLRTGWRYMRSRSRIGMAAGLILLLAPFYSLYYNNLPAALTLTMLSLALAWRDESTRAVRNLATRRPSAPPGRLPVRSGLA